MSNKSSPIHFRALAGITVWMLLAGQMCFAQESSGNRGKSDPASVRQAACASLQVNFDRIVNASSRDSAVQETLSRLTALDDTSREILRQIASYKTAFLNRSLATVVESGGNAATKNNTDAVKLLENKTSGWPTRNGVTKLSQEDQQILQEYYSVSIRALIQLIQSRAQACIANTAEATSEVIRLATVLPLLTTADETWVMTQDQAIPDWMRKPEYLRSLENMALRAQRPRTAYALSSIGKAGTTEARNNEIQYVGYLRSGTNAMLRERQYATAITYLRHASTIAAAQKNAELLAEVRFQIAEVLASTDSPQAGANEITCILRDVDLSQMYGKAAMLRLKYLYQAKQTSQVIQEVKVYQTDSRCTGYLDQIYYIAWMTQKKAQAPETDIDQWQNLFLTHFPNHPLGADMYFTKAANHMIYGEYSEALRLLHFIEYRYPNTQIKDRVQEMKDQIESFMQASSQTHKSQR